MHHMHDIKMNKVQHIIFTLPVFSATIKHKKNFDIQFSMKRHETV